MSRVLCLMPVVAFCVSIVRIVDVSFEAVAIYPLYLWQSRCRSEMQISQDLIAG
jgi:hypothetical protein